jgi:hypothetical protein
MAADSHAKQLKTPEQVRAEIERTRADLALQVTALRQEMDRATDWRGWVREHPIAFVTGAFVLGFILADRS